MMTEKEMKQNLQALIEQMKNTKVDMKMLRELIKNNPDRPLHQNIKNPDEYKERNLALSYSMLGDYEKSMAHATAGLKINPKSAYLLCMRGRSKGDLGKFDEGLNDLNDAINLDPKYAEAFMEKGYILQKIGDLSGARSNYKMAISLDPALEQEVDKILSQNSNELMTIPSGVIFKLVVKPSITKNHQQELKELIKTKIGLNKYYKNIDVTFFDGSYVDNNGLSTTNNNLIGKQMEVKVFCPEPTVLIGKDSEESFYKQIKEKASAGIIEVIKNNIETKYSAELGAFYCTQRILT